MINRRNLLRGALCGAGMSAFSSRALASASKALGLAGPRTGDHKLLFVFMRGGNDGANTLIPTPQLDPTYLAARPTLQITNGIQLPGVPSSRLNPNLARLVGIDHNGHLALVHQAGDTRVSRSHFDTMDVIEKGMASSPLPTQTQIAQATGFVPKALAAISALPYEPVTNLPTALSVSPLMQTMFTAGNSSQVSAHVRDLGQIGAASLMETFGIDAISKQHGVDHFLSPQSAIDQQLGLELTFGHSTNEALETLNFAPAFGTTGRFPLSQAELQTAAMGPGGSVVPNYDPAGAGFMAAAEQAVFTLVHSACTRVVGIEYGGFDTHVDQAVDHPNLLRYFGWVVRDIYEALRATDIFGLVTVVFLTEFGRTAQENNASTPGTDHGAGALWGAIDVDAVSGTHNIHGGPDRKGPREHGAAWRDLLGTPSQAKYANAVEIRTGHQDFLAEVLHKRLGVSLANLPSALQNYPTSAAGFLNFLH